jgi:hypothetical protein
MEDLPGLQEVPAGTIHFFTETGWSLYGKASLREASAVANTKVFTLEIGLPEFVRESHDSYQVAVPESLARPRMEECKEEEEEEEEEEIRPEDILL